MGVILTTYIHWDDPPSTPFTPWSRRFFGRLRYNLCLGADIFDMRSTQSCAEGLPCSHKSHLMGPILEESNLIQIYWTVSLIIMHCLGWCHIMPPVQSLPLQNHPFENLWTKNREICGSHLQVFGKVLKINKNNENQKNKNLTSEVLWSDSFCPLSCCPCGLRNLFQKKRKHQCTGTHY